MIIVLLFPIAAICRSTWRKEGIIYVLLSFQCYLHEYLDLIIIFFTLLQKKLFKTIYFSKYYHCSSFRLFWYFCCKSTILLPDSISAILNLRTIADHLVYFNKNLLFSIYFFGNYKKYIKKNNHYHRNTSFNIHIN
jgi:hypothetical protein